jgi:hypothetical protein
MLELEAVPHNSVLKSKVFLNRKREELDFEL